MQAFTKNAHQVYFLYGSNAHPKQIAARCGRAERLGAARLADHRLAFFGHSGVWDSGEETVTESPGDEVWGVLCRLLTADADELDAWQGVRADGSGPYFLSPVTVRTADGADIAALVYRKDFCGEPALPSQELLNYLVEGAVTQALPIAFVERLRGLTSQAARYPVPKCASSALLRLSCQGCN